jgi:predicted nucleic acid-binding protein
VGVSDSCQAARRSASILLRNAPIGFQLAKFRVTVLRSVSGDALIIALAAKTGAEQVLSEDLNPDQVIAGVTVSNPFLELPPLPEDDAT